jgi:hypothetical protein
VQDKAKKTMVQNLEWIEVKNENEIPCKKGQLKILLVEDEYGGIGVAHKEGERFILETFNNEVVVFDKIIRYMIIDEYSANKK